MFLSQTWNTIKNHIVSFVSKFEMFVSFCRSGVEKSSGKIRKHVKPSWQQFWVKKNFELFLRFWGQKFRNYVILYAKKMDLCRGMLGEKGVLAPESHKGQRENMWKQFDNNFKRKNFLNFFWDFGGQKFRNYDIFTTW